jgi:hypothetical protein
LSLALVQDNEEVEKGPIARIEEKAPKPRIGQRGRERHRRLSEQVLVIRYLGTCPAERGAGSAGRKIRDRVAELCRVANTRGGNPAAPTRKVRSSGRQAGEVRLSNCAPRLGRTGVNIGLKADVGAAPPPTRDRGLDP